jgi:hypothetical protein
VISIMSTSRADDRAFYQKYRGFKRCAIMHAKTNLRVASRFAPGAQLRVREATKARDALVASARDTQRLINLRDLITAQAEVFKRLHTVLLAAEAVNASATYEHPDGTIAVSKDALITMCQLTVQAGQEASRQMRQVEEIMGRAP